MIQTEIDHISQKPVGQVSTQTQVQGLRSRGHVHVRHYFKNESSKYRASEL